jgi:hypothetical protein
MRKIALLLVVVILLALPASCAKGEEVDETQPAVSDISISNVAETSAVITWTTDEPATSQVDYGLTSTYGESSVLDSSLVKTHAVLLSGLASNTTYHYRAKSRDESGNEGISQDHTFTTSQVETPPITDLDLAAYWAPIWYQDTDDTDPDADYITNFDFDSDWDGANNWENQPTYPLPGYVYYWIMETDTHWFIGYADFHPRDWTDFPLFDTQHENDMEGCLLVIEKNGLTHGQFLLMVTVAHSDFHSYKDYDTLPSASVSDGHETIDGDVQFDGHHPYVYVEAEGHGVYGDKRWEENDFPGGDGVIYRYAGVAEEPESGNDRNVTYALRHIDELWDLRNPDEHPNTFDQFGTFRGDITPDVPNMVENAANAPWGWDDVTVVVGGIVISEGDGEVYAPDFFTDPAYLVDYYHNGLGDFSHSYVDHQYI